MSRVCCSSYAICKRLACVDHRGCSFHQQDLAEECGLKDISIVEKRPPEVEQWTLNLPVIETHLRNIVNKSDFPQFGNTETKIHFEKYSGKHHIYTDGSKHPDSGKVASTVVYIIPSIQFEKIDRLSDRTSIYTAELLAIKNAMCWINESNHKESVIF